MRLVTANESVVIHVSNGSGQATCVNALHLRLQLEGAWVSVQIKHFSDEPTRTTLYQKRFAVQVVNGKACVDRAQIDLCEAPLFTGSDLAEVEGLDAAFTQLFQTFLRYHRRQLIELAWAPSSQSQGGPLLSPRLANGWLAA